MADDAQQFAQETARKDEFEHQQFQYAQTADVNNAAKEITKPSSIFYGMWYSAAFLIDAVDIFIGFTMVWGIITSAILLFVARLASKKIQHIQGKADLVEHYTNRIQQRGTVLRNKYAKGLRRIRKTKVGRKFIKSPFGRACLGLVANIIAILNLLPWQVYSVYTTHKAHKEAYASSIQAVNEYQDSMAEEASDFSQEQIDQSEEIMAQAEDEDMVQIEQGDDTGEAHIQAAA